MHEVQVEESSTSRSSESSALRACAVESSTCTSLGAPCPSSPISSIRIAIGDFAIGSGTDAPTRWSRSSVCHSQAIHSCCSNSRPFSLRLAMARRARPFIGVRLPGVRLPPRNARNFCAR